MNYEYAPFVGTIMVILVFLWLNRNIGRGAWLYLNVISPALIAIFILLFIQFTTLWTIIFILDIIWGVVAYIKINRERYPGWFFES